MMKACAYCGVISPRLERDHVIPRCLYATPRSSSKIQRIVVPACSSCNRGWSDDEAHFRNVLCLAGEPNGVAGSLWPIVSRSFDKTDGRRRLRDLFEPIVPEVVQGEDRWKIYPARDDRVLRVLKKIIRGLSTFHEVESAVPENRIWVDVMKYLIPKEVTAEITFYHRESEVIEYWYETYEKGEMASVWFLRFFERVGFVGAVSRT